MTEGLTPPCKGLKSLNLRSLFRTSWTIQAPHHWPFWSQNLLINCTCNYSLQAVIVTAVLYGLWLCRSYFCHDVHPHYCMTNPRVVHIVASCMSLHMKMHEYAVRMIPFPNLPKHVICPAIRRIECSASCSTKGAPVNCIGRTMRKSDIIYKLDHCTVGKNWVNSHNKIIGSLQLIRTPGYKHNFGDFGIFRYSSSFQSYSK